MVVAKNVVNKGYLQGILKGDVSFPNEKTAVFTVKIKDNRVNPETNKRSTFFIQCVAFDDVAEKMREAKTGQLLFVDYHLSTSKRLDDNGVATFFKNRVVDNVIIGELLGDALRVIPYINEGICQGEFVSVKSAVNAESLAYLTIRVTDIGDRHHTYYLQFIACGPMIETIEKNYFAGDNICLKYKIETSRKDGKYYQDYIISQLY